VGEDIKSSEVCFPINEYGWILLFQKLGKVVARASKFSRVKRISDEISQHRVFEIELEGGVRVRSKLYDTSDFIKK